MNIHAIILAGGLGVRLAGMFPDFPKALAPVGQRLFIERQLDWLARQGVKHTHLAAGHQGAKLRQWMESAQLPLAVTISVEPEPLGTGGGVQFASRYIQSDPVLVLNGDSLLPALDLPAMCKAHGAVSDGVTLAVAPVENAGRYGLVDMDDAGRVIAFREKAAADSGLVNGGVYLFARELLKMIPPPPPAVSLELDVFPALSRAGAIHGFVAPAPLLDMGTPDGLRRMAGYFDA